MQQQRIKFTSAQRTSGSPGSYRIDLREVMEAGTYRLNEVFVCNSYYNVNATNNVVYWNETSGNKSTIIVPGIYSSTSLATAVAAAITVGTTTGSVFTGSYSAVTGKMAFVAAPATPFTFLATVLNSIGPLIGFNGTEISPSAGGALQANVSPILSLNLLIGSAAEVRDAKGQSYSYVVPVDKPVGSYIRYNSKVNYDQLAVLPRASSLLIQVVDDNSVAVPLLLDWYFIL